jgi:predicted amidophosphoribosyltransferase
MAFTNRWNPRPKGPKCPQCQKRDSIQTRPDKLCANCAKPLDERGAEIAKHDAAAKAAK